jgi:hypothetical protein
LRFLAVGDVDFVKARHWAKFGQQGIPGFFVQVANDDFGAFFGKTQGGGFANPDSAAGDEGRFIFQTHFDFSFLAQAGKSVGKRMRLSYYSKSGC